MIDPFSLITWEQKHGLKRHKHQKIEQGKGYNMVKITHFHVFPLESQISPAISHIYLCLPMFTPVYSCLPVFTCIYICDPILEIGAYGGKNKN